jgi:hypothetical protein
MFLVRRVCKENESGHPGFDYQKLVPFDLDNDPLSATSNSLDAATTKPAIQGVDPRLEEDRAQLARRLLGGHDLAADDRQDSAPHRFNFGQLGQLA